LLTGEPGEVNSLNSIFRSGFTQEKSRHRAECGKSFHGDIPPNCSSKPDARETTI
jgi:hypothetical protein